MAKQNARFEGEKRKAFLRKTLPFPRPKQRPTAQNIVADHAALSRAAIHEAGHACVALALGADVINVRIASDASGICNWRAPGNRPPTPEVRATVVLAGGIAVAKALRFTYAPDYSLTENEDDDRQLRQALGLSENVPISEMFACETFGGALITSHTLVNREWLNICDTADALIERRSLSGAELLTILTP